jgi:isohexenylglutaconyl-CoA hydratase
MSANAREPAVLTRRDGAVLHLTLNRPQARNAMNMAMVLALRGALAAAERDASVRVLVLRGAAGHFCAGADISEMATARMKLASNPNAIAELNAQFGELCADFGRTGLAVVAVVEGTAMGGGFGLACAADVAIAGESAVFRLPETSLGVVPAQIAPYLVERLGYSQARRLAVTGGRVDAQQALAIGLVHELHADTALDAALQRTLHDILQNAPQAVAATKALIAKARLHSPASLIQEAAEVFSRAALSAEGTEGQTAFLQKRKANWMPQ